MKREWFSMALGWGGAAVGAAAAGGEAASVEEWMRGLRPEAPRLLFTEAREAELRRLAEDDAFLAALLEQVRGGAEWARREPVVEHRLEGPRLLAQSRAALAKIGVLALAHRWWGEEADAERAWAEIEAVLAFPDWNPAHLLDTAELCAAVAIGYDWLHEWLGEERRARVREGLVRLGLEPALAEYPARVATRPNNWNFVGNGGFVLAALAIADVEPRWAREYLGRMQASLPYALRHYAPDGAWFEGPGYWKYGTTYLAMLLDGLETALGTDGGLGDAPGLARTGEFFRQSVGPSGLLFNYADSGHHAGSSPTLFWLARRYGRPELATLGRALLEGWLRRLAARHPADAAGAGDEQALKLGDLAYADLIYSNRFLPWEVVWYQPAPPEARVGSAAFAGPTDVAFLRARDESGRELYLAMKGHGRPDNHAHLDAGSFVLDIDTRRWVADLGPENYDLPGYWEMAEEGRRWGYFRLNSQSHNVVTVAGQNQRRGPHGPMVAFAPGREADGGGTYAQFDLGEAYRGQLRSARRGAMIRADGVIVVQDELEALSAGAELRWAFVTPAAVVVNDDVLELRQGEDVVSARILAPAGASWAAVPAVPARPEEKQNEGYTLVSFRHALGAEEAATLAVAWRTGAAPPAAEAPRPLATWGEDAGAR